MRAFHHPPPGRGPMGRAGLVPLGSQSYVWYGDAPAPVPSPGTALSHARRGDRKTEEGHGWCCNGARNHQLFSTKGNDVPPQQHWDGAPKPSSAGGRHWTVLQPSQAASLAEKEQTGCEGTWGAAGSQLGLAGHMGLAGHTWGSQLLQRSRAAARRQRNAQPAQLSLLCQGS